MRKDYTGFGYNPQESRNYFDVVIGTGPQAAVSVYERFAGDPAHGREAQAGDILKLTLSKERWSRLEPGITAEFNRRLRAEKKPAGRFTSGSTPVEKLMGKELMVLLWGTEHNTPAGFPTALRNWLGLQPEERWWLYTMTNASTGGPNDRRGWRTALRYALCEQPEDESEQLTLDLSGGEQP